MDSKQIQEVTDKGLRYVDNGGEARFIDFEACYQNYLREKTSAEFWEWFKQANNKTDAYWDKHLEMLDRWRQVGVRNMLYGTYYIEFHTNPPIRFEYPSLDAYHEAANFIG